MNEENLELGECWTEEFAPKSIEDMVLSVEQKNHIKELLKSKTKFNQLFCGPAGIGKSTICNIIAKELNASVLYVQGGINGTVSYAQTAIKNFCDSLSIEGKQKIVIIDEIDATSGSGESNFQKSLRNIINDATDTMFLANCNYLGNVIEPLQSRLGIVRLKFSMKDLWTRLAHILKEKNVSYTRESLEKFVKSILKTHYPDIRRIISDLQKMCSSGTLVVSDVVETERTFVSELVEKCRVSTDLLELRQFYLSNKSRIGDYLVLASETFNYLLDNSMVKDPNAVLKLSNVIYQMNVVVDKEIQFFSFMTIVSNSISK